MTVDTARDHIFGCTIFNDFSARDQQAKEMPGMLGPAKGKSFDGSNVLGPWIVTRDEIPDPYSLKAQVRVNGAQVFKFDGVHAVLKSWLDARQTLDSVSAYLAARKAMTEVSDARVLLGGKMGLLNNLGDTYQGAKPGIIEEAVLALEAGIPCVPLGAFGGAARDVAIALDLLDPSKRVPRGKQSPTYGPPLEQVAALRDSIPGALRPALMALADDDRGEPMAYDVADALERWLSLKTSARA